MPQIPLPTYPAPLVNIGDVLQKRKSCRLFSRESIALEDLSFILGNALRADVTGNRPYPSGGKLYPIETYLLVKRVSGLLPAIYHYRPDSHALERLWEADIESRLPTSPSETWIHDASVVFFFTAQWERSYPKYDAFAFELALIEAGHLGQNILLSTAVRGLGACPWGGFSDASIESLLDLEASSEQCVYAITLGIPLETEDAEKKS